MVRTTPSSIRRAYCVHILTVHVNDSLGVNRGLGRVRLGLVSLWERRPTGLACFLLGLLFLFLLVLLLLFLLLRFGRFSSLILLFSGPKLFLV